MSRLQNSAFFVMLALAQFLIFGTLDPVATSFEMLNYAPGLAMLIPAAWALIHKPESEQDLAEAPGYFQSEFASFTKMEDGTYQYHVPALQGGGWTWMAMIGWTVALFWVWAAI